MKNGIISGLITHIIVSSDFWQIETPTEKTLLVLAIFLAVSCIVWDIDSWFEERRGKWKE